MGLKFQIWILYGWKLLGYWMVFQTAWPFQIVQNSCHLRFPCTGSVLNGWVILILNHTKSEHRKAQISNGFWIFMFGIRAPAVFYLSSWSIYLMSMPAPKIFTHLLEIKIKVVVLKNPLRLLVPSTGTKKLNCIKKER